MTLEEGAQLARTEREQYRQTMFYGFDCVLCDQPVSVHAMRDADPPICYRCRSILKRLIEREVQMEGEM